jgi:hypothetical protein
VSLAKPHCQNCLQRSRKGRLANPFLGSRGPAPGILRSLLSLYCSNSRRVVQWFLSGEPVRTNDNQTTFASVRLCECEPRMMSGMKSARAYYSFKILAKIAASQGCYNPVGASRNSRSTPFARMSVDWPNRDGRWGSFVRASAHFFLQICIRAEARRGYFPLLALQVPGIAILLGDAGPLAHQPHTGPP